MNKLFMRLDARPSDVGTECGRDTEKKRERKGMGQGGRTGESEVIYLSFSEKELER